MTNSVHSDGNPSAEAQQEYWDDRWGVQKSPNDWQQRRADALKERMGLSYSIIVVGQKKS